MPRLLIVLAALALSACTPLLVQHPLSPPTAFSGPRLEDDAVVSFDGARLGLKHWDPVGEPWAVIVGVHGMNDYSNAFHLAAPWWASQGVATYAYDQRGFGRSPERGVWAGEGLMTEDLRTVTALVRRKFPHAIIAVAGESMGGAVAAVAFASDRPPAADRLILMSPAVWGWKEQPLPNKTLLWFAANFTAGKVYEPPRWLTSKIKPTDNREELIAMGRDPQMIWGARSDALYGLVSLMSDASDAVGRASVPTFYLHGAHDQIIPKAAAYRAAAHLKPADRSANYAKGYHLLMRDHEGPIVWADVLAFIRDPQGPLPSGAPAIPHSPAQGAEIARASGAL
ncbi:MAG TPA: alpha/beta fold hydrolase [Phenylobacterium sp.]|uniref:alpha/beta fold hydrolase n=1 Tax=Phenylobacterium sp. TaxID=1871053 RepID=UPI002C1A5567|nr:alpha/beta fold hydrolase [Phenylobacterium sp.]HSV03455.1 alpha/beta fold hydrolase [Phenylobacterium sp.]